MVTTKGIRFKHRNAFWADLNPFNYLRFTKRGPKLFFKQIILGLMGR